jgi:hypothetical protein
MNQEKGVQVAPFFYIHTFTDSDNTITTEVLFSPFKTLLNDYGLLVSE